MYKHIPVGTLVRIKEGDVRGVGKIGIVGGHFNQHELQNIVLFGNRFRGELYYFSKELDILNNCEFPYSNYLIEPSIVLADIFGSNVYSPLYCNWCYLQTLKKEVIKYKHKKFIIKYCPKCLR